MHPGAFDRAPPPLRSDVLVFATPPLDHELEVTGPITARQWIASDAPDTDFTAKLIDVYPLSADYPHGSAMNLTEGLLRARYRDSWERPAPMVPGEVNAITIELFPIANLFCRGHRLRLDFSSSNFPHFHVHPNSGEPEGAWQPCIAHNRIFRRGSPPLAHPVAGHSARLAVSGLGWPTLLRDADFPLRGVGRLWRRSATISGDWPDYSSWRDLRKAWPDLREKNATETRASLIWQKTSLIWRFHTLIRPN